jgi:hypothetical protein
LRPCRTTAELASTKNYEISGEDKFCKKPLSEPRKAGEVWVDDEGILPFSSAMCTLGAYADYKAKGKKIDVTYVFDTARGIKLFADQAFFAVGGGRLKRVHEVIFPVAEVLRPIPAIAWVPMAIMLWPTNEQSIVFITFLGSFFPIPVNTSQQR